ncbi:MAG: hypothetical protein ACP5FP_04410 [Desulfuromonadaceae bacterium]
MAMSAAERQAIYRTRRSTAGENGERRLNTWISTGAALALKRLAAYHGKTQRQILDELLFDAEEGILQQLRNDEAAFNQFLEPNRKDLSR